MQEEQAALAVGGTSTLDYDAAICLAAARNNHPYHAQLLTGIWRNPSCFSLGSYADVIRAVLYKAPYPVPVSSIFLLPIGLRLVYKRNRWFSLYNKTKVALHRRPTGKELGSLIGLPAAHLYLGFFCLAQGFVCPGRRLGRERGIEVETSPCILAVLALQQARITSAHFRWFSCRFLLRRSRRLYP